MELCFAHSDENLDWMVVVLAIGYYEHDVEVRFAEGIISLSKDWRWFVAYTEHAFNPSIEMKSMDDFLQGYVDIGDVFLHFSRIADLLEVPDLPISSSWLARVYDAVLVGKGSKELKDALEDDGFFDVLCIAAYGTYLMNCVSDVEYDFNLMPLRCSNLHLLHSFDSLGEKRQLAIDVASSISIPGFQEVVDTLRSNFFSIDVPVDDGRVSDFLDKYFDRNFLSFKRIQEPFSLTWQEALLYDVFKLSFVGGEIVPMVRFRDGSEVPDVSSWSKERFDFAKDAFSDDRAVCVIETVEYLKYGEALSVRSQELLVGHCIECVRECVSGGLSLTSLLCTSFYVVESLIECKAMDGAVKEEYFRAVRPILSTVRNYDDVCLMCEHSAALSPTKEQRGIFVAENQSMARKSLASVGSAQGLIEVFKDARIAKNCTQEDFVKSFELFNRYAIATDILAVELFYWAMQFCIEAQNNSGVDNHLIRSTSIALRRAWRERYYGSALTNMHVIQQKFDFSSETAERINEEFLDSPRAFCSAIFLGSDKHILEVLESISRNPVSLCATRTSVSEHYPERIHVSYEKGDGSIDGLIAAELKRVYDGKSYRFLNALTEQVMLDGFYMRLGHSLRVVFELIDLKSIYEWISVNLRKPYELLSYPESGPLLGHVVQMFPILENVIREISELFGIVPFQMHKENYTRLREVSGSIGSLLGEIKGVTKTVQGCDDFLLVYHVMYSPNGFNVRNECIHGRSYQDSVGAAVAFRMTVICLYLMLRRLHELELAGGIKAEEGLSEDGVFEVVQEDGSKEEASKE